MGSAPCVGSATMAQAYLQRMTPQSMMLTLLSCLACLYVAGRCVRIPIDLTPYLP